MTTISHELASTLSQILRDKALTEQVEENSRLREALRKEQSKNVGRKDSEYAQLVHMLRILFILVLLLLGMIFTYPQRKSFCQAHSWSSNAIESKFEAKLELILYMSRMPKQ